MPLVLTSQVMSTMTDRKMQQAARGQKSEVTMSPQGENDGDNVTKDKAVVEEWKGRDARPSSADELPTRVVIVDDPQKRWPFTWKDILDFLVQLLNITAVLVFGIWAVRSYDAALQAVSLAEAANTLVMFQICQSNVDDLATKAEALQNCYPILNNAMLAQPLRTALSSNLGVYAAQISSSSSTTQTLTQASPTLSLSTIISISTASGSTTTLTTSIATSFSSDKRSMSIVTSTTSLASPPTVSAAPSDAPSSGLSLGGEIAIVVGIVFALGVVIIAMWSKILHYTKRPKSGITGGIEGGVAST